MRTRILAALLVLSGALGAVPGHGQEPERRVLAMCADCHAAVDDAKLDALGHADTISCLSCHHVGFTNDARLAAARRLDACRGCHSDVAPAHVGAGDGNPSCTQCHTIHADLSAGGETLATAARCGDCHAPTHALHGGVAPDAGECSVCHTAHSGEPFDGAAACATCHAAVRPAHADVGEGAPRCSDCHSFSGGPSVAETGPVMSRRCGACHTEAMDAFWSGGHAQAVSARPNPDLPTCVTCHGGHRDVAAAGGNRLAATAQCIACHSRGDLAEKYGLTSTIGLTFLEDFHGATVRFQLNHPDRDPGASVLVCADCHGPHAVGWSQDAIVADVCRRCHEAGDDRLAGAWLGHTPPGPSNQVLVWLVRVFYWVLIPFMLGGLFLQIAFHLVDQRRKGARVLETEGVRKIWAWVRRQRAPRAETVQRFPLSDRLEHLGSMITFALLVVTGLPQTRPDLSVANTIIGLFGGIAMTRLVHRVVGFAFVALMVVHVGRIVVRAMRRHRLPMMVPSRKDFDDVLQTFRHYLFRERRPKVGKFDFSQKFEYWGLFLGAIVMSSTGLILVFPELVTRLLPGEIVAAGRVMHGLEATFAVLVVVLWHSYGVILRPEIFPLDTTIFTGRMTVDRLRHEHRLEYERLFPERAAREPEDDAEDAAADETASLLRQGREGLAGV